MTDKIHILPPADILDEQPELLYKIGFKNIPQMPGNPAEGDVLQRAELGKRLSNIVENIADPLTIALNGGWGSGKTWFLKHWAGAHKRENRGEALTVYISAFNHDYLEDPLPSIILAIDERLGNSKTKERKLFDKVKSAASQFAVPALKIGGRAIAAALTAGHSEDAIKAGIKATEEIIEKEAESYWQKEEAKRKNLEKFRTKMAEFAETQPLVIIIDELDRAKPDYALAVLEIIKHFFNVKGIKFILGVNLAALAKMVIHRYGLTEAEAHKYLERFIHLPLTLPDIVSEISEDSEKQPYISGENSAAGVYTEYAIKHMNFNVILQKAAANHIRAISYLNTKNSVSLRDAQRILSQFALITTAYPELGREYELGNVRDLIIREGILTFLSSAIIRPDLYPRFIDGTITDDETTDDEISDYFASDRDNSKDFIVDYEKLLRGEGDTSYPVARDKFCAWSNSNEPLDTPANAVYWLSEIQKQIQEARYTPIFLWKKVIKPDPNLRRVIRYKYMDLFKLDFPSKK